MGIGIALGKVSERLKQPQEHYKNID